MRTPCVRHCRAGQPWLFRLLGKIDLLSESYAASSRLRPSESEAFAHGLAGRKMLKSTAQY